MRFVALCTERPTGVRKPRFTSCQLLPALDDHVDVFRIEFDQPRPSPSALGRDERGARSVLCRLVEKPDISLIAVAAPVVVGTLFPAIEDRLVVALVIGPPKREGVLRLDYEGRPLATGLAEGLLQRVELQRRHADVDRALGDAQNIDESVDEQSAESIAERIVLDACRSPSSSRSNSSLHSPASVSLLSCNRISLALRLGPAAGDDGRNLGNPFELRYLKAAMAGDQHAVAAIG